MSPVTHQKLGWYGGLLGGSLWLLPAAVTGFARGDALLGLSALGTFAFEVALILALAPWRHPTVRWWKLFLPVVAGQVLFLSALGDRIEGFPAYTPRVVYQLAFFLLMMTLLVGRRRWVDFTGAGKPSPVASLADPLE